MTETFLVIFFLLLIVFVALIVWVKPFAIYNSQFSNRNSNFRKNASIKLAIDVMNIDQETVSTDLLMGAILSAYRLNLKIILLGYQEKIIEALDKLSEDEDLALGWGLQPITQEQSSVNGLQTTNLKILYSKATGAMASSDPFSKGLSSLSPVGISGELYFTIIDTQQSINDLIKQSQITALIPNKNNSGKLLTTEELVEECRKAKVEFCE